MKTPVLLLLIQLLILPLAAQEYSTTMGNISKDELEMETYENDPEAEAVVVYDLGNSKVQREENQFVVMFTRKTRIKILSEAGLDYAEVEIPVYQDRGNYERIMDLEGTTYNYNDGKLEQVELDPSDSYKEKINEYWAVEKFVMPGVKVGSVIEYTYRLRTENMFNLRDWEFQRRIPTIYSEYTVRMVPFYSYTYIMQGASQFDKQESYEDDGVRQQFGPTEYQYMVHTYGMKDIPAFRDEEYITSINDYIMKLDFQLSKVYNVNGLGFDYMTTWEDMVKEYLKDPDFGKYMKKSGKQLKKFVGDKLPDGLSDSAKINLITGLVKSQVDWDGMYSRAADCTPAQLLNRRSGNVVEINLFLTGLLKAAGLEAYPVMISTRDHGKIRLNYPFSHFFNYVIAAVKTGDGSYILADATSPRCANNRIPTRCINDKGLIFRKDDPGWVSLAFSLISEVNYNFGVSLTPSELQASVGVKATEYEAYQLRNSYGDDTDEITEELVESYENAEVEGVEITNAWDTDEPYTYSYNLRGTPEQLNNKLYIDPFPGHTVTENPFKQQKRTMPIDLVYPRKKSYHSEITIPEGYAVEYKPDPIKILNKDFSMEYEIHEEGNKIEVDFFYVFHNSVYPANDYFTLKFYYNELIKKANDKIVLLEAVQP